MPRKLTDKEFWKMELHVHTVASHDSLLSKIPLLIACKIKKIDCIAITDHNTLTNALSYKPLFEKYGVRLIVGEEIMTTNGEIIGLFLNEHIAPKLSLNRTCSEIVSQGGLIYVPHPYDTTRSKTVLSNNSITAIQKSIHMMECHNGRNRDTLFSDIQESICNQLGVQKVVGSDAHTLFEIGRNYAWIKPFDSPTEFLENLSCVEWVKAPIILWPHTITKIFRALKMIMRGHFSGLLRAIKKRRRA
jgi:predicted metal-dependent phosphoesterase TrpH